MIHHIHLLLHNTRSQAKITNLGHDSIIIISQKDITWLQVTMNQALLMNIGSTRQYLSKQFNMCLFKTRLIYDTNALLIPRIDRLLQRA